MRTLSRLLALAVLSACRTPAPTSVDAGPPPPKVVNVVVLGPLEGWFPRDAPRVVEHWRTTRGWPDALVLATGLSPAADALTARLDGAPTSALMKAASVAAVTLGPRDVDLGVPALLGMRAASGAQVVLSNVLDASGLNASTFAVFERSRVKVGVIGVSGLTKADGPFGAVPLEGALQSALDAAASQAVPVVVALVNGCSTEVRRLVAHHPEWKLDLVVASPCPDTTDGRVGTTTVLHVRPGQYAALRAELGQVRSLSAQVVDAPTTGPELAEAAALRDRFLAQLAEERARVFFDLPKAPTPGATALLVATALRDGAKVDAGLFSRADLRAPLEKGPLARGAVLDALPASERVLLVDVPGEVLLKLVSHPDAFLALPAKVDPNGAYVLATTEHLYREGIGLEAVDANPVDSDLLLPSVVLAWLETQRGFPAEPKTRR